MGTFNIIMLILGIAEPLLAANGVIPANYQGLAQGILNAITQVKADLTNSQGQVSVTTASLIAAINAGIQALAAAGALGAASGLASALSKAVAAGETAETSVTSVDPTKLQPIS
jgi:hypothetical protein